MNITGLLQAVSQSITTVTDWCGLHPIRVDVIVGVVVFGSIALVLRRQRRVRRRLHRILWGTMMKRKDLHGFQQMQFEDAIVDIAMEMVHRGDMNEAQEKEWFRFFAEKYTFGGLIPGRDVKRGVRARLAKLYPKWKITGKVPGGVNKVEVDKTYDPKDLVEGGLSASKYVK